MDLSCIISSGDLELYVLGLLPEAEAYQIQQLALLFPEVEAEINRITETLLDAANTSDIAPSPSVKNSLFDKIKNTNTATATAPDIILTEASSPIEQSAPVFSINQSKNRFGYLLAASLIGLLVCIGLVIYLVNQNSKYQQQIATIQQHTDTLQQAYQQQQQQLTAYEQTMHMLQDENYRKINMTSVPGKPEAVAQILWNQQTHDVYVADISLPTPPAGKQYQLWAIVNGQPVDAGMLSDVKNSVQKMKPFDKADAFAITLEKAGGSPKPTMEAMYVMGKV